MFIFSPLINKLFNFLPSSIHLTIQRGEMKGINWIPKSANPGQVFGRYEPEQEKVLVDLLKKSNVFWDVGAHVGWYSMLAAKNIKQGCIHCFEPNPDNIKFIKQHININQFNNIHHHSYALSSTIGEKKFDAKQQQGSLSDNGNLTVTTITADQFISNYTDLSHEIVPDLIKVDIEGAELEFLKGAINLLSEQKPTLVLSAHGYKKRDLCIEFLNSIDYNFQHLVSNHQEGDYVFLAHG